MKQKITISIVGLVLGVLVTPLAAQDGNQILGKIDRNMSADSRIIESTMVVHGKRNDRTIMISGHMLRQSVMGSDLSYEDMMDDRRYEEIYNAKVTGNEQVDGRACHLLTLTATVDDAAYPSQKLWVDSERFIPLQMDHQHLEGTRDPSSEFILELFRSDDPEMRDYAAELYKRSINESVALFTLAQEKGWMRRDLKPELLMALLNGMFQVVMDEKVIALFDNLTELTSQVIKFFLYGVSDER